MSALSPDRYVVSVDRIDLCALWDEGVRLIMLDRDNTLVPRDDRVAPPAVEAWLKCARELGFELWMISNNWHFDEVGRTGAELGLKTRGFCCKPVPFALMGVCKEAGVSCRQDAVMVGDQLFTDIWAGKLAGCRTILVRPQCQKDLWYTHIFRFFERRALAGVAFEE